MQQLLLFPDLPKKMPNKKRLRKKYKKKGYKSDGLKQMIFDYLRNNDPYVLRTSAMDVMRAIPSEWSYRTYYVMVKKYKRIISATVNAA